MHCFYHAPQAAVGTCKNCSKGICSQCAADEGFGLACKGSCEGEVEALWKIIQNGKTVNKRTSAVYLRGSALYGLMGLLFELFPFFFPNTPREIRYLFLGIGSLFLVGMAIGLFNAYRMKKS